MDRGDLAEYLTKYPQGLPFNQGAQFASDILEGLNYMHDRAMVHRDLKPANILLKMEDRLVAKITGMCLPSFF